MLNLTQHPLTAEQIAAGGVELPDTEQYRVRLYSTFDTLPSTEVLECAATDIAAIAAAYYADSDPDDTRPVLIGGAPFFMSTLEAALWDFGLTPFYAFSKRESVEEAQPDGSVAKRNVFRHLGWVQAATPDQLADLAKG